MGRRSVAIIAIFGVGGTMMLSASPAVAAPCTAGDMTHPTIASAVLDAGCDPILLGPITYTENIAVPRTVEIIGAGAGATTWNGGAGTALTVGTIGDDATVEVSGVSFTGTGKGINILEQDTLVLSDSVVTGHSSTIGAGIDVGATGTLTGDNLAITNNTTTASGNGAGINNLGTVNLTDSTISGNVASVNGAGAGFRNGASTSSATLTNVTITNNRAGGDGGGFNSASVGASAVIRNSTIARNRSDEDEDDDGDGAGLFLGSGATTLQNTIVGDNNDDSPNEMTDPIADECAKTAGTLTRAGHVLIETLAATNGAVACTFSGGGDTATGFLTVDPQLGAIANNGGPTQTLEPTATSPALDKIPVVSCLTAADQRGVTRPQGALCDLGAVERSVPAAPIMPVAPVVPVNPPSGPAPAVKKTCKKGRKLKKGKCVKKKRAKK